MLFPMRRNRTAPAAAGDLIPRSAYGEWVPAAALVRNIEAFAKAIRAAGGIAYLSPAPGALGRHLGPGDTSTHNVDEYGELLAADVMVSGVPLVEAYRIARDLRLFNGLGVYPHWRPSPGLHLDMRPTRTAGNPALWGRIGAEYVGVSVALAAAESVA